VGLLFCVCARNELTARIASNKTNSTVFFIIASIGWECVGQFANGAEFLAYRLRIVKQTARESQ